MGEGIGVCADKKVGELFSFFLVESSTLQSAVTSLSTLAHSTTPGSHGRAAPKHERAAERHGLAGNNNIIIAVQSPKSIPATPCLLGMRVW